MIWSKIMLSLHRVRTRARTGRREHSCTHVMDGPSLLYSASSHGLGNYLVRSSTFLRAPHEKLFVEKRTYRNICSTLQQLSQPSYATPASLFPFLVYSDQIAQIMFAPHNFIDPLPTSRLIPPALQDAGHALWQQHLCCEGSGAACRCQPRCCTVWRPISGVVDDLHMWLPRQIPDSLPARLGDRQR